MIWWGNIEKPAWKRAGFFIGNIAGKINDQNFTLIN